MDNIVLPDAEILFDQLVKQIQIDSDKRFALVGIHTGGVWLAERLHQMLNISYPLGTLSASFYRDDFDKIGLHAQIKPTEIPFAVDGTHILLIDDVLQTGRTIRAAINALFDYGRPASVSLAVLVDRGGKELPICAHYIGTEFNLPKEKMIVLDRDDGKLSLSLENRHDIESVEKDGRNDQ